MSTKCLVFSLALLLSPSAIATPAKKAACLSAIERAEKLLVKNHARIEAYAKTLDINYANIKAAIEVLEAAQKADKGVNEAYLKVLNAQAKDEADHATFARQQAAFEEENKKAQDAVDRACETPK